MSKGLWFVVWGRVTSEWGVFKLDGNAGPVGRKEAIAAGAQVPAAPCNTFLSARSHGFWLTAPSLLASLSALS